MTEIEMVSPAAGADDQRPRRRIPGNGPAYELPVLVGLVVVAAFAFAWGIGRADYHSLYGSAVRSMTESWKAFFFGSFDPGNAVTLDKVPGFLWPQALSARVFGFHPWSLILPQVLEGVATVVAVHVVVRRWVGVRAGLLAAAAMLATPVVVGLFRTAVEDPMFTLCAVLAAEAAQRAARGGRLRTLTLAAFWVGVGFQAKQVEAWGLLPALALVYLVSAPPALRRRLAHLTVAGLVTLVVSGSWMFAVALTPAADRPYVDGTTDDSPFSMVLVYNFLTRFTTLHISPGSLGSVSGTLSASVGNGGSGGSSGAAPGGAASGGKGGTGSQNPQGSQGAPGAAGASSGVGGARASQSGPAGTSGTVAQPGAMAPSAASGSSGSFGHGSPGSPGSPGAQEAPGGSSGQGAAVADGPGKLFEQPMVSQVGWLYPLAAAGLVLGLVRRRGKPRTDPVRAGFLLFGAWLAVYFLAFTVGSIAGHTYYLGVLAVPLAALAAGGTALMWRDYRTGGRGAWALPAVLGASAVWSAYESAQFPSFQPWLEPGSLVLGAVALVLLVGGLLRPGWTGAATRFAAGATAAGLAAVLLAPAVWGAQVFSSSYKYSMVGGTGPSGQSSGVAAFLDTSGALTPQQQRVFAYAKAHQGGAEYTLATTSWLTADPFILTDGAKVLAMGGFTGDVPYPTLAQFQQLTASGRVRFFMSGGAPNFGTAFGASLATNTTDAITIWARAHCAPVPASIYGGVPQAQIPAVAPYPFAVLPIAVYDCSVRH